MPVSVFQILAVIILIIFYGCYYAKKIFQRRKGIQTTQIGKGKAGFSRMIEILMGISAVCIVIAELISIDRDFSLLPVPARIAGIVIAVLMLHLQIVNNEEDAMIKAFGDEYLEYRRHVNRYFGRQH